MAKITQEQEIRIAQVVVRWQDAAKADYIERFGVPSEAATHFYDPTSFTIGAKYAHLVIRNSSAFLVDIETGIIYGNKGWLKVDKNKIVGNAYDPSFDASALVRDRFRYGHFENAQNGSLRQPIVRR